MSQLFSHLDFSNRIIAAIKEATGLDTVYADSNDKRPPFPYFAIASFKPHDPVTIDVVENEVFLTGIQIESHSQSPYEAQDNLEAVRKVLFRDDVLSEFSKANMRPYTMDGVVDNTVLADQTQDYNYLFTITYIVRDSYVVSDQYKPQITQTDIKEDKERDA